MHISIQCIVLFRLFQSRANIHADRVLEEHAHSAYHQPYRTVLCHHGISAAQRQSSHSLIYTGIDSRSGYCVSSFHIQRSGREGDCATRSDVHRRGGASEVRGGNQADCITAEADNAVHLYAYNNDE